VKTENRMIVGLFWLKFIAQRDRQTDRQTESQYHHTYFIAL